MADNLIDWVKLFAPIIADNFRKYFQVLKNPPLFINSIDHSTTTQLISASVFAALISLINLAINIPVLRLAGVHLESVTYVITDTLLTYGTWFVEGSLFYLSAVIMRGKANHASSVCSYLYLTAFIPLAMVVGIPAQAIFRRLVVSTPDTVSPEFYIMWFQQVSSSPSASLSITAVFIVFLWYLFSLVRVYKVINQVGWARGIAIISIGLIFSFIFVALVSGPASQVLWKAFTTTTLT